MEFYVGTDVGGTFTDLWVGASDGRSALFKSPTSANVLDGVLAAVRLAADAEGLSYEAFCSRIRRFGHGTTIGLNALLTGRAARTAVLTTTGFADTLTIGRLRRQTAGMTEAEYTDAYLRNRVPPLVPRELIFEIDERVDATGRIVVPLDLAQAEGVVRRALDDGAQAVAICLLWATQNPGHERALGDLVRRLAPQAFVCLSHEISPAVGEYARMSTTAANAALGPVAGRYLNELESALHRSGMTVPVLVMTCAGGVLPSAVLNARPVSALFSGPAAGVIGSAALGRQMNLENLLTTDIGGTSFDVGVVHAGKARSRTDIVVAGADMRVSSIDVASIGAGGGSIARVDRGELRVGPDSAGANPGPACYGRGGKLPTATDADLVLGVLNPGNFVAGRLKLDLDAATRAIEEHVARPLGLSVQAAAWGIREVLDNKMADLLRRVTIERGYDPMDFTLLANGGAGPSHAWVLCRELGLPGFVVPAVATTMSAFGTGNAELGLAVERPVFVRVTAGAAPDEAQCARMRQALRDAEAEVNGVLSPALHGARPTIEHGVSMRFAGQSQCLEIQLGSADVSPASFASLRAAFTSQYEQLYGSGAADGSAGVELVAVRASGVGRLQAPERSAPGMPLQRSGSRRVVFGNPAEAVDTAIYTTSFPRAGERVAGPAIVEYPGQCAVIPPGASAVADAFGNLHVRLSA